MLLNFESKLALVVNGWNNSPRLK